MPPSRNRQALSDDEKVPPPISPGKLVDPGQKRDINIMNGTDRGIFRDIADTPETVAEFHEWVRHVFGQQN